VRVTVTGARPASGCLVTNHLSYLDIMVLASVRPVVFVSKAEVRRWPGIGYLVGLAGTLFIRRQSRLQVSAAVTRMQEALDLGVVLAFFPEGTTTGGDRVLPFRASLLEAAVTGQLPVTPGCLRYELPGGSVPDEVCYWRDMTFFSHLANLCRHREIRAHVTYGEPMAASQDRKQLAHALRQEVLRLGGFPPDAGGEVENF
jgi:1-acyl-sn-glycerol-3-phosphate acyltransferase